MDFFDATKVQPSQGGGAHPLGIFDAMISDTKAASTKDGQNGMLVVTFTTPAGVISSRYNLWNSSAQAVEIARKELSALCHVTSIYRLSFPKLPDGSPNMTLAAAELRNARCKIEVTEQLDKERKPTGYVEIKRVLDVNGNEPGKVDPPPQPQQQPGQQTTQNPGQQGWGGTQQAQPNPQANPAIQNWGNPGQVPPNTQSPQNSQGAPQQQQPNAGWTQQQNPSGAAPPPPWGNRG